MCYHSEPPIPQNNIVSVIISTCMGLYNKMCVCAVKTAKGPQDVPD